MKRRSAVLVAMIVVLVACQSASSPTERSEASEESCDDRDVDCPGELKICPDPACEGDCYCEDRTCDQLDESTCADALVDCQWVPAEADCDCACGECPNGADCTKYCSEHGDSESCCDRCAALPGR